MKGTDGPWLRAGNDQTMFRWLIGFVLAVAVAFGTGIVRVERLDRAARIVIGFGEWQQDLDMEIRRLSERLEDTQKEMKRCFKQRNVRTACPSSKAPKCPSLFPSF